MKVLFIGNSFSQDANIYLHRLATASGGEHEFLNLIIGGCSLQTHANNAKQDNARVYMVQYNGRDYGEELYATLEEGLAYRDWDYISVQQVSGLSGLYDTYHPYIDVLLEKVRAYCPRALILLHQTWAYEHGADHSAFPSYDCSPSLMTKMIIETYRRINEDIGATGIAPCGNVIQTLRDTPDFDIRQGGVSLHRDGFHLGNDYGRYAAAAVWYQFLGLGDIMECDALPDGENIDMKKIELIKKTVKALVKPIAQSN